MIRRRGILLAGATALGFVCMGWVENCANPLTCKGAAPEQWTPSLLGTLILTACIVCAVRSGYLLWRTSGLLARFETVPAPAKLVAAMHVAQVSNVRCLADRQPLAFCSGVLKPQIQVTTGLLKVLSGPELEGVLRHERHHSERRHPLLRALLIGAGEVFFFLPILNWLFERMLDDAELAADRAAIRRVGYQAVAAALWRVGTPATQPRHAVGFGGAAELRVAQLLGEPMPARRPSARVWIHSLVGVGVCVQLGVCVSGAVASLLR